MGLEPEVFYRDKALPQGMELEDLEREYFEGERTGGYNRRGGAVYRCRRVELNDLASDPDRFIAWVVGKLEEHGCGRKLVPPRKVVLDKAKVLRAELVGGAVGEELSNLLNLDALVTGVTEALSKQVSVTDLPDALADWANELQPEGWDAALAREVKNRVKELSETLRTLARRRIRQAGPDVCVTRWASGR
jgi:hypothetical protein